METKMKKGLIFGLLLAAAMPLAAQELGAEYRLKRVIPVEGRQGIAADSAYYYVSGSTALYKYDKQGRLAAKNEHPFEGLPLAANHIGDIDVWNGEIYAGIETFDDGRGENIQVAVYDANTLEWKRSIDWEPASGQVEVCGLAVDRDGGMVWMADWVDGRYVYGYDLSTGRYVRKVHLRPVPQWQQGIFMAGGRGCRSRRAGQPLHRRSARRKVLRHGAAVPFDGRFPAGGRDRGAGGRSRDGRSAGAGQPGCADRAGGAAGILSGL